MKNSIWLYILGLFGVLYFLGILIVPLKAFKIPSKAMEPIMEAGDHILTRQSFFEDPPFFEGLIFNSSSIERGDIVVFKYPKDESKYFIKRVIGLPGDTIEISSKKVIINQSPLIEPYTIHIESNMLPKEIAPRDFFGPMKIPEDSYFVMGDNRDHSLDSRFWGFVKKEKIIYKPFMIYWSWDKDTLSIRWNRIGNLLN